MTGCRAGSAAEDRSTGRRRYIGARVAALHEIERPRHDTHVDAFFRRAALKVLGVAAQRDQEPLPRALRVDGGEDPGMGDEA